MSENAESITRSAKSSPTRTYRSSARAPSTEKLRVPVSLTLWYSRLAASIALKLCGRTRVSKSTTFWIRNGRK